MESYALGRAGATRRYRRSQRASTLSASAAEHDDPVSGGRIDVGGEQVRAGTRHGPWAHLLRVGPEAGDHAEVRAIRRKALQAAVLAVGDPEGAVAGHRDVVRTEQLT